MKKIILRSLIALLFLTGFATITSAQRIYVKIQPTATVVERPAQPSPQHVWIQDEWVIENGTYVRKPGYWTVPQKGRAWVPGHWAHERGGYYWVSGHWRKL